MANAIINLDELLSAPKRVELAGRVYDLPGDLPAELYLRITGAAEQDLAEHELVKLLYGQVLELFQVHQPDVESLPLGLGQLMQVIRVVYGGGTSEPEGEAPPTTPKTRGATGAAARSRSAKRSR